MIPARYASSRFPGKPLAMLGGKTMIRRVYEQCMKASSLAAVVVATDDDRIFQHVQDWGGKVVMTRLDHRTGTDRVAEAARHFPEASHVINVQGDEPFLDPGHIDLLAHTLLKPETDIATLVRPLGDASELHSPNRVKVVRDHQGLALYFSRSPIPAVRDVADPLAWPDHHPYWLHVGVYAFRGDILPKLASLPPAPLEQAESLEQLRWLEYGFRIRTARVEEASIAVDTPEDLERAEAWLHSR